MLGFLTNTADLFGKAIGTAVGGTLELSQAVLAKTLDVSQSAVEKAIEAGCVTSDDIKNYLKK